MLRAIVPLFVLIFAGCAAPASLPTAAGPGATGGTVVLLHGYGRRPGSLGKVEKRLADVGFRVCNLGYPSLRGTPTAILDDLEEEIARCASVDERIDFVTHSFGGILARAYARRAGAGRVGRVVMLAPPNHGSELSDLIGRSRVLSALAGPVVADLGTGPTSLPNRLGPPVFAVGVIAGDKSVHPVGSFVLDGPNDGTVTVASARLAGMRDFAVVPRAHSFIMNAPEVIAEVEAFLANGCFSGALDGVAYETEGGCARYRELASR